MASVLEEPKKRGFWGALGNHFLGFDKREKLRQENEQRRRSMEAIKNFPQNYLAMQPPVVGENSVLSPEYAQGIHDQRQQKASVLGDLAAIAPQATATAVLGEMYPGQQAQNRTEQMISLYEKLYPGQPLDPERFFDLASKMRGEGGLEAQERRLRIAKLIDEEKKRNEQNLLDRQKKENAIQDGAQLLEDMVMPLMFMQEEATFARTGQRSEIIGPLFEGVSSIKALGERWDLIDGDTEMTARQVVETFGKDSNRFVSALLQQLAAEGVNVTDSQRALTKSGAMSTEMTPGANLKALIQPMRDVLRQADQLGIEVENKRQLERYIQYLSGERRTFNSQEELDKAKKNNDFFPYERYRLLLNPETKEFKEFMAEPDY